MSAHPARCPPLPLSKRDLAQTRTLHAVRSFGVETGTHGEGTVVALTGDLDLSTAKRAEQALQDVERESPSLLVIDLRRLSFMDSTGLRVIVSADKRAKRAGRRAVIVQGPAAVRRVFEITRLDQRLEIVDTPDEIASA